MSLSTETIARALDGVKTRRHQFWEQRTGRVMYWNMALATDAELDAAIAKADASIAELEAELRARGEIA